MIKKIFGINEKGEKVELNFNKFLMITENGSELELSTEVKNHPEGADFLLNLDSGPVKEIQDESGKKKYISLDGHRYLSVFPGAVNLLYIKAALKT